MASYHHDDKSKKRRMIMKYLLGGESTPMAGDGSGVGMRSTSTEYQNSFCHSPPMVSVSQSGEMSSPELVELPAIEINRSSDALSGRTSPAFQATICSSSSNQNTPSPMGSSFSSANEWPSSISTASSASMGKISSEDCEIPEELGIVGEDAPHEIRNIILESFAEKKALEASKLQQQIAINHSGFAECSACSPVHSPSYTENYILEDGSIASMEATNSFESGNRPAKPARLPHRLDDDSTVSVGSRNGEQVEPRNSQSSSSTTTSLASGISRLASQPHLIKERTAKSHKIFKLLPSNRKLKFRSNPSPPTGVTQHFQGPKTVECTSCFEDVSLSTAISDLPCQHSYCAACFTQLILTSVATEATFPPKCCLLPIPPTTILTHLSSSDTATYNAKTLEYAVPQPHRYYCPDPPCARWIDTRHARRTSTGLECPHCHQHLCPTCRGPAHPSRIDCPHDAALTSTLLQAEESGWQRCFQCRALVERNQGCRHITCKCGAQFCYTCGKRWRTCQCTEADQVRLDGERARKREVREREEEEVRKAVEAVERAEQALKDEEEKRRVEEEKEATRLEEERVERWAAWAEGLRNQLMGVKEVQRKILEGKWEFWVKEAEERRRKIQNDREQEVWAEKARLEREWLDIIDELEATHAKASAETLARHWEHQDELVAMDVSDRVSRNPYSVRRQEEALKRIMMEVLVEMQKVEVTELEEQHRRERRKWQGRMERAVTGFGADEICARIRAEEGRRGSRVNEEGRRRREADWRWFASLWAERVEMLEMDLERWVSSGADAPEELSARPQNVKLRVPGALEDEDEYEQEVPREELREMVRICCFDTHGESSSGRNHTIRTQPDIPGSGYGLGVEMGRGVMVGG